MSRIPVFVAAATLVLSGCAGIAFSGRSGSGVLYADTRLPEQVGQSAPGAKTGEACASSILGWVTTGDASIAAATRAGAIKKISTVDNKSTNILGVYSTFCTVVTGD